MNAISNIDLYSKMAMCHLTVAALSGTVIRGMFRTINPNNKWASKETVDKIVSAVRNTFLAASAMCYFNFLIRLVPFPITNGNPTELASKVNCFINGTK